MLISCLGISFFKNVDIDLLELNRVKLNGKNHLMGNYNSQP